MGRILQNGAYCILAACVLNALISAVFYQARLDPGFSPISGAFIRTCMNLVFVLTFFPRGLKLKPVRKNKALWLWGLSGCFNSITYFCAIPLAGAGLTNFLNAGSGIFIGALAPILAYQHTSSRQWIGLVCSIGGLYLILNPTHAPGSLLGPILAIVSGASSGLSYLMIARSRALHSPESVMLHWTVPSLAAYALVLPVFAPTWPQSPNTWLLLICAGCFAACSQYLTARAYLSAPAPLVACLTYLGPVLSIVLDIALFGLSFSLTTWLGCLLVLFFGLMLPLLQHQKTRAAPQAR